MVSRTTIFSLALGTALVTAAAVVSFLIRPTDDSEPAGRLLLPDVSRYDSFEYRSGDIRIACRMQSDGSWLLEEPLSAPADTERIKRFLNAVSSASVRDTLDLATLQRRGLTLESLGLQPPGATLDLRSPTGTGTSLFWATNAVQGRVHVQTRTALLSLDEELLDALPTDPLDFLNDHFLPYSSEVLRRFEIQRAGESAILFQKTAAGWTCQRDSVETRVDDDRIDRHFSYLFKRRVRLLHTPSEAVSTLPVLDSPEDAALVARYWFDAADASGQLRYCERRFGGPVPSTTDEGDETDGPREVYLYASAEHPFATVESDILAALREGVEHFRDKRVFPGRHPDMLQSLRIRDKTDALFFDRSGEDGQWHLVQPAALNVRANMFDAFLRDLLSLSDTALFSPAATNAPAGDDATAPVPPELRCELELAFVDGTTETAKVFRAVGTLPDGTSLWNVPNSIGAHVVPDTVLPVPPWDHALVRTLLDTTVFHVEPTDLSAILRVIGTSGPSEGAVPLSAEETAALAPLLAPLAADHIEAIAPYSVEPYGLLAPHAVLTAVAGIGEAVSSTTLLIGDSDPGGGRYAMLRGGYTVYVLADETVRRLLSLPPPESTP